MKIKHTYKGVELIIEGNLHKGETEDRDYPGSPDRFEITAIYAEGDIQLLIDDLLSDIEGEIIDNLT